MSVASDKIVNQKGLPFTRDLLYPKYWLSWLGVGVATVLSVLPQSLRHRLGVSIGEYLYKNSPKRRKYAGANLRQVYPEVSDAALNEKVRQHLHWYGKGLVDYTVFFFAPKRRLKKLVGISGGDSLLKAAENDKAIILLLTHSVMLEFAAVALSLEDLHSFGSYKKSKNPVLDWMIARSRCRFVDFVVSREDGLRPLVKAIQSKKVMIFLPDEDLGLENGVFAPFFGRQKATLTTPARLAKLGKAEVFAGFVAFDQASKRYNLHVQSMPESYPCANAEKDASVMNQAFESLIEREPLQYMWLMRLFKTTQESDQPLY